MEWTHLLLATYLWARPRHGIFESLHLKRYFLDLSCSR